MLKGLILGALSLAMIPMMSMADKLEYTAEEVNLIEDALDHLITPARVDVGVGVGEDFDRPGRPTPRAQYACYARDAWGRTYDAVGFAPDRVERRALSDCRRSSSFDCRSLGCRRVR